MSRGALPRLASGALVALSLTACVSINEAIRGHALQCQDTPDADCIRVADVALTFLAGDLADPDTGPIERVLVTPMDCTFVEDALATRCWEVEIVTVAGGAGQQVHERKDGTLHVN